MPSVQGVVKCNGSKIVGTFYIDGPSDPRYLAVEVNPRSRQQFECSNATLTYDSVTQLLGACKWSGTVGKDDLKMNFGGGLNIAGQVTVPLQSSTQTSGTGTWDTVKSTVSNIPANPFRLNATRDRAKEERERALIQLGVPIIAIFGQSGTGKSSFINLIVSERQTVGEGLQSCTIDISVLEAKIDGKSVVIIDTPGIDDTREGVREADVLKSIANHLNFMGELKVHVTGVLFLHRISDNKFSQTANRVSNMLKNLCGNAAMNQLMLCTTMWDRVPEEEGYKRFDELCETGAWKEMILGGASMATFSNAGSNAKADAEEIVTRLIKNAQPVELDIQDEMGNKKLKVVQTAAGQILNEHLQGVQAEARRELEDVQTRLQEERKSYAARAQDAIRARESEVARLKEQENELARQQQVQAQQLKREQEKMKRMSKGGEVNAAKAQERERELARLKQQAEELTRQKNHAKQLKEQRMSAVQAKKEAQKKAKREAAMQAAKAKEELLAQQREIDDAKKQVDTLAGKSQRGGILKLFGL